MTDEEKDKGLVDKEDTFDKRSIICDGRFCYKSTTDSFMWRLNRYKCRLN